jgi:hypothetical protein
MGLLDCFVIFAGVSSFEARVVAFYLVQKVIAAAG